MTAGRTTVVPALLLAAAVALAACGAGHDRPPAPGGPPASGPPAEPSPTGPSPTEPSPTGTPGTPPTAGRPPKSPTDVVSNDGSVVGTVTRVGPGRCFGLVTDDGTEYALHHTDDLALTKGTRVRAHLGPASPGTDCGPGRSMQLRSAEPL